MSWGKHYFTQSKLSKVVKDSQKEFHKNSFSRIEKMQEKEMEKESKLYLLKSKLR